MVQGQGQTAGLCTNVVGSNLLKRLLENCQAWYSENKRPPTIDVKVIWSKVKVKLLVIVQMLSTQYLLTSLPVSGQTWYNGCP